MVSKELTCLYSLIGYTFHNDYLLYYVLKVGSSIHDHFLFLFSVCICFTEGVGAVSKLQVIRGKHFMVSKGKVGTSVKEKTTSLSDFFPTFVGWECMTISQALLFRGVLTSERVFCRNNMNCGESVALGQHTDYTNTHCFLWLWDTSASSQSRISWVIWK